jgi:hypothetical protein
MNQKKISPLQHLRDLLRRGNALMILYGGVFISGELGGLQLNNAIRRR